MKKIIAVCFCLLFSALSFVSCGCQRQAASVYYLNFKPEIAGVYERIAADYQKETGIPLRVNTAASGTYEQTLKSELGKRNAPTIFQFNGPVGYQAWKGYCADLSQTEIYKHLNDPALAFADENGVWGIPYVVEGYGLIYNKEITDRYFALSNRATSVGSMEEIRSFETLKAVVQDMTAKKAQLGIDGVFGATSLKTGEEWRWTTHLANVPLHYEFQKAGTDLSNPEETSEIVFDHAAGFKALFDLYLNNSTTDKKLLGTKQVADSMAEFALGKCAMIQNGNWAWSQIKEIEGNKVKAENIKMMPLYIGAEGEENQGLCIGTENYLAINKNASPEDQKAAADFLYWLYSSETGKRYVIDELNFIAPFDTFSPDERPSDPLSQQVIASMEAEGIHTVTWDFTVMPGQSFKEDFGAALLQYAQGSASWQEVVDTFVRRWKEESI